MASVITHPAIPLTITVALGPSVIPRRLAVLGIACSVLPDSDALGLFAGVPYGHLFGHRGFSHSIAFAVLAATSATAFWRGLHASRAVVFGFVFLSTVSHGLLDALTNGGLGIAFFSPFSNRRYFLPWRILVVSPLELSAFLSRRGLRVLASELLWVWVPCIIVGFIGISSRRSRGAA
jgi:inner membrane protein